MQNLKWSGKTAPPAVGQIIKVGNGIGEATVLGYFSEEEWLGVKVQPVAPPEWYIKQNGGNVPCTVFGAELVE